MTHSEADATTIEVHAIIMAAVDFVLSVTSAMHAARGVSNTVT